MYVVIVGGGNVGEAAARWLISAGHEVAVVDYDQAICDALDESLGSICVKGDGTDAVTLDRAGTSRADAVIVTTSHDDVNMVCCQLANHRFGVSRSISLVNDHEHLDLFRRLGVDVPVDTTDLLLGRIQRGLTAHGLVQLMNVSEMDNKTLVSVKIPSVPGTNERRVGDLDLPGGTLLSLVISRDGSVSTPQDDTVLHPGDEVIAVTSVDRERDLRDILVEGVAE